MPVATNIVLADAQATPVNHTFIPLGADKAGVWWYEDQSQASPIGYWRVSLELVRPALAKVGDSSANRSYKVKVGLHQPVLEVVSNSTVSGILPAPSLSYVPKVFTEYLIAERSSLQNRKDLRKMNYLLQADTQLVAMVENLQGLT